MRVSAPSATTLERALLDEWNTTLATTSHLFGDLGELTCDEAIDLIRRPQPAEDRDRVLLTLLELNHAGDEIAGKVILKSFLALAFRLARTSASTRAIFRHSPTDATATTIGTLWEVIHTYPMERTHSVAGNIRWECVKRLTEEFGSHVDAELTVEDEILEHLSPGHQDEDPFRDLVTILTWAIDSGTLTRDEIQLLVRIELADRPSEEREIAADDLGVSRETLNKRVSRIRAKLMKAVCGDIQERVPYAPRRG